MIITENHENKIPLLSLLPEELEELCLKIGEPKFRAKQLFAGMHAGKSPEKISNVGKNCAEKLSELSYYYIPGVEKKLVSKIDGTVKYLFGMRDGNCVETVIMKYEHGYTVCISSQVGCRMGCAFCASTVGGLVRSLGCDEMLGQIIAATADMNSSLSDGSEKFRISNIVMMGIGEPLDNYDNAVKFLRLVNHPDGLNIGYRHISLSTCGLADNILRLAKENLPITLSISLHACDDATRNSIMPVNKKYNIDKLLSACAEYYSENSRRISFEYTLISGVNDSEESALKLARLLNSKLRTPKGGMPLHVNLIPVNAVAREDRNFTSTGREAVMKFAALLEKNGITATVRRRLGSDINASCGQLRRASLENK